MFFICISIFGHELKCSGLKPLPEMVLQKKKNLLEPRRCHGWLPVHRRGLGSISQGVTEMSVILMQDHPSTFCSIILEVATTWSLADPKSDDLEVLTRRDTVDGRNPAPPGIVETI